MNILKKSIEFLNFLPNETQEINLKKFTQKKTYLCINNNEKLAIIYSGKTKFLLKNALFVQDLYESIAIENKISSHQKYFIIQAPLCSKAKNSLLKQGFIINAFM